MSGRVAAVLLLALTVANCSSTKLTSRQKDYGVKPSPRVIPEGQPIPKGGGREMVGKPYVVGGRTYVPKPGAGYDRQGYASWYGSAFQGRLTANGEVFDREAIMAAHPTLPLPSYVRVTNLENRRSMVVRVSDRGPYEKDRLIDLSERAAVALDFHRRGTTKVRVQYLRMASVGGSDDRKLLATLRTDAHPASFDRHTPVMLAAADKLPASDKPMVERLKPRPEPAIKLASAADDESWAPAEGAPEEAPAPKIAARMPAAAEEGPVTRREAISDTALPPIRPAVAQIAGEPSAPARTVAPLDIRPPARPVFAGIY